MRTLDASEEKGALIAVTVIYMATILRHVCPKQCDFKLPNVNLNHVVLHYMYSNQVANGLKNVVKLIQ